MPHPLTALSDYALGAAGLAFAWRTFIRLRRGRQVSGLMFACGFLGFAIAGLAGGVFHQLRSAPAARLDTLWSVAMSAMGAAIGFLASAIHASSIGRRAARWMLSALALGLAGCLLEFLDIPSTPAFDANDALHLAAIAALCLLHKGVRSLADRPSTA